MNAPMRNYLLQRFEGFDKQHSVIVGDADGVDRLVIEQCVEREIGCMVCFKGEKPRNFLPGTKMTCLQVDVPSYAQRDRRMVDLADCVVAVWNGVSPGTKRVADYARSQDKPVRLMTFIADRYKVAYQLTDRHNGKVVDQGAVEVEAIDEAYWLVQSFVFTHLADIRICEVIRK